MGSPVSVQLLAFGQSILLGLSAGVLYDVLRPFRLRCPRITTLLDGAYCLTVGAVSFLFFLRRADGELRGFLVLGALGRYAGLLSAFVIFSTALAQKFWQKNGAIRKKSLLFCRKMLYNKKN